MNPKQTAAQTLVTDCLNIQKHEVTVIISEKAREEIAYAIQEQLEKIGAKSAIFMIEDYIARPATDLPAKLKEDIQACNPQISIYAATAQAGELPVFRRPLMKFLTKELNCRHAHMVGIDYEVFELGMNQDYKYIHEFTHKITEMVKKTSKIHVTCPYGTDITFEINNEKYAWEPASGRIWNQGEFSNLPDGETFTYPEKVNGKLVAWVLGDSFDSYGVLKKPIIVDIKDSYITNVESETDGLKSHFEKYITEYKDGNRVGELGIGTLTNLKAFTGNLLLDEKFPGIHVAFGSPYPDTTGAEWDCPSHVDIIPKEVDIEFFMDGEWVKVMEGGRFLV